MVDLRTHRLPDRITLPAAVAVLIGVGVAALIDGDAGMVGSAVVGAVVLSGFLFVVHLVNPAGMGFGDVKFGLSLGLALGATSVSAVILALFLAVAAGAVVAVAVLVRHRDRHRAFPFGPCLAVGTAVALILAA